MTSLARNRYPGPPPFEDTPGDRLVFFGRDQEIVSASQLIIASRLVVIFGKSGLGKTSLLNAGIFPRLREQTFLPVRVRIRAGVDPVPLVTTALRDAASRCDTDITIPDATSLWEIFKRTAIWHDQTLLTPVLAFDQFEEVFTFLDAKERGALADELGYLVSGNMPDSLRMRQRALPESQRLSDSMPHVRVILSLREEYLAALEELSPSIPQMFQDRVRLLPLSDTQAVQAVRQPASFEKSARTEGGQAIEFGTEPFQYDDSAVEAILKFLHGRSHQVESWELQLLCMHIEQNIVPELVIARPDQVGPVVVTAADLGGPDALRRVLGTFYNATIAKLPAGQGRRARELCDTGLVGPQGRRLPLERDQILSEWKVSDDTLNQLVDDRLLRRESKLESTFYEISHDTLAETILSSRRRRLPRRLRVAAWVFGVMVCCGLAAWAWEYRDALREKGGAARARSQSEELMAFLAGEDSLERLERTGQLTVLEEVEQRVKTYLNQIPAGASTRGSGTVEAFGRLNEGDLELLGGHFDRARAAYQAATVRLRSLRDPKGVDAVVNGGLARALQKSADVAVEQGDLRRAVTLLNEALGVREGLVSQNAQDDRLRRRLAAVHGAVADVLRKQGHLSEASHHVESAVRIVQAMAKSTAPEWDYLRVDVWDVAANLATQQRRYADAEGAYHAELEAATRLKMTLPFEPLALYDYGIALYHMAELDPAALDEPTDPAARLTAGQAASPPPPTRPGSESAARAHRSTLRTPEEKQASVYGGLRDTIDAMTRWEPRNKQWARELAAAGILVGSEAGSHAHAAEAYNLALDKFRELASQEPNASRQTDLAWAHLELAAVVPKSLAVDHMKAARDIDAALVQLDPSDRERLYALVELEIQRAHGEKRPEEALKMVAAALAMLEAVKEVDPTDGEYFDLMISAHTEQAERLSSQGSSLAYEGARKVVEITRRALAGIGPNSHFLTDGGRALRKLGAVQLTAKDPQGASASFDEAAALLRQAAETASRAESPARAWNELFLTLYDDTAGARTSRGDLPGAARAYRESMEAVEKAIALAPEKAVYRSNLSLAHQQLGDTLRRIQPPDFRSAEEQYDRSRTALEKAIALDTTASRWNSLFLLLFSHVAPLRGSLDRPEAALDAIQQALKAVEHSVALAPSDPDYQWNLHLAHGAIGDGLVKSDPPQLPRALIEYANGLDALNRALALKPNSVTYLVDLARTQAAIANALEQQQPGQAAARAAFDQAVDAGVRATVADARSVAAWNELAVRRFDRAEALGASGDIDAAVAGFTAGLAAEDRALALDPQPRYYASRGAAFTEMAKLLEDKDLDKAAADYQRAVESTAAALRLAPDVVGYRNQLVDRCTLAGQFLELKKKDAQRAAAAFRQAVPYARGRALESGDFVRDQLALVAVLLGLSRTGQPDDAGALREEAVSALKRVDDQGKLPKGWQDVLHQMTRR